MSTAQITIEKPLVEFLFALAAPLTLELGKDPYLGRVAQLLHVPYAVAKERLEAKEEAIVVLRHVVKDATFFSLYSTPATQEVTLQDVDLLNSVSNDGADAMLSKFKKSYPELCEVLRGINELRKDSGTPWHK